MDLLSCYPLCPILQRIHPLQGRLRLQPLRIISIHKQIPHHPPPIHQQCRRDRHLERIIAITRHQIVTERLENRPQAIRLRKDNAQLSGELVAHIRQDGEFQLVLFRRAERLVGKLGRDRDEGDALGGELVEVLLQGAQLEVAEGTPLAAVEADEQRALGEQVGAVDLLAQCVAQVELRECVAHLDGGRWAEGGVEVGVGGPDRFEDRWGSHFLEMVEDGGQLAVERHACGQAWLSCALVSESRSAGDGTQRLTMARASGSAMILVQITCSEACSGWLHTAGEYVVVHEMRDPYICPTQPEPFRRCCRIILLGYRSIQSD